jgi:hypothetical protein
VKPKPLGHILNPVVRQGASSHAAGEGKADVLVDRDVLYEEMLLWGIPDCAAFRASVDRF